MVIGPALLGKPCLTLPGLMGALVAGASFCLHREGMWIRPRIVAGLATAAYWVALARQLLSIPDAATLRGGQFPPTLAWSPGEVIWYHYGAC